MPQKFEFNVPITGGIAQTFRVATGQVLYLLGANGAGKSSLVARIFQQNLSSAKRIAAHRQTWFESNALNITPHDRNQVGQTIQSQDSQPKSRHWEWNPQGRANIAIFDFIDADTTLERKIAALVRSGDVNGAAKAAQTPSPIQILNELMRTSNLPIAISLEEGQKIMASKGGGSKFSVAELSDGERNAFLIAADVLTVKPDTLIVVDEPERHLHRSIISPLLRQFFERRSDCAFIVATHEVNLPLDTPKASILLVRSCEYAGNSAQSWNVDILEPGAKIDDDLKRDLLGARSKILFVEGDENSLDFPFYSILFPGISVVPKSTCRDVEYAVRGLRAATDVHWATVWGLVDKDQRSADDVARLRDAGVWALSHYSVKSLYYHPKIIARVAQRRVKFTGGDATALAKSAIESGLTGTKLQKDHLVTSAVLRSARAEIMGHLPLRADVVAGLPVKVEADIPAMRLVEDSRFDALIQCDDWDGLLARYPLRESQAFGRVVSTLGMADEALYRAAVLKLLQDDPEAIGELLTLLGDLPAAIAVN